MKKQRLLKIVQSVLSAESGRSMVEMLGVLAIIGVLSIGAVGGYKFALNKFRANETINELNMRALSLSTQLTSGNLSQEELSTLCDTDLNDGFSDKTALGYGINAYLGCPGMRHFEVYVQGVDSEVCRLLMRDYTMPLCIVTGDRSDEMVWESCLIDESQCGSNQTVDMAFIYNNDLINGERSCPARAEFNPSDYRCHCGGGTYVKNGECECPAGFIWDEETASCYEGLCVGENFYSSRDGKCIPCSDLNVYNSVSKKECEKCSDRYYTTLGYCVSKNFCPEGFFNAQGTCFECSDTHAWYLTDEFLTQQARLKCPNFEIYGSYAIRNDWCKFGSGFLYMITGSAALNCISCTTDVLSYSRVFNSYPACDKCLDNNGNPLRKLVLKQNGDTYCVRATCHENEFKGSDGACYSCDETDKIAISSEESISQCQTCGRIVTEDGFCQKDCSEGMLMTDGRCYSCEYFEKNKKLLLSDFVNQDDCGVKCLNRSQTDEYCVNPQACQDGFMNIMGDWCYPCNTTVFAEVGVDTPQARQCIENCNGHVSSRGFCILKECLTGYFQGYSGTCYECSTAGAVLIGKHSVERTQCSSCKSEKRFWAGEYCYRCDTSASPNVTTDEEISNCTSCGREVAKGKCVLKTSE